MKDIFAIMVILTLTTIIIGNSKQMNSMTVNSVYIEMASNNSYHVLIDEIGDELITLGITSRDLNENPVLRLTDDSIVVGNTYGNGATSLYADLNDWEVTERLWLPKAKFRLSFEEYKISEMKSPDVVYDATKGGYVYE